MVASSVTIIFGFFVWRQTTGVPFALVQSETFTLMVISQWFNVLNCRSAIRTSLSLDVLKNRWLVGGLLLGVALHFLVIYMPSFNRVFHTVPIAPGELLLLVILGWLGVVSEHFLRAKRRQAIVINFVIAMLLTPPDAVSMLLMGVPLCLIYELCILLIRARELMRMK